MPTASIARPSKIYPNLNFWFENIPSGNPGDQMGLWKSGPKWSPNRGGSGLIFTGSGRALALYFGLLFYAGLKISLKK
jgi:hypothetical protein